MSRASAQARLAPTLIVGLGDTGLSCARFLERAGEDFAVVDSRTEPPGLREFREHWPAVPLDLGPLDAQRLKQAQRLVLSPGVSRQEPAVAAAIAAGVECIGDIELFAHVVDAPVIAITGSNGKSTVTSMLGALLAATGLNVRTGGNLGPPALDLMADGAAVDAYVLELSSFQLETTFSLRPAAAAVLNVSADHMDRYASLAEYAAAKGRIYNGAQAAVVNRDDPGAARLAPRGAHTIGFTAAEPVAGDFGLVSRGGQDWLAEGDRPLMPVARLALPGGHDRVNALAALALVRGAGIDAAAAVPALATFAGLPHRTQLVAETAGGVRWYDDSKGTNPGATAAALDGMAAPVVLIAGGEGKGADFSVLREPVAQHVRAVVLIGRDADHLAAALGDAAPIERAPDMEAAVARAAEWAQPGDAVLLSPACASFDMFTDYRARGEAFAAAVARRCA